MVLLTNESIVRSYELLSSSNEDIEAEKQFFYVKEVVI